jgi:hypothetical protein
MSAFVVGKAEIDLLVQAGINERLVVLDAATPSAVGAMLWAENVASVNWRYDDADPVPDYEFSGIEAPLDDVVVVKQIACYRYQSCEHDGWESSEAYRYCHNLAARIAARHPEPLPARDEWGDPVDRTDPVSWAKFHPRYESAPWGIHAIEEAIAS